jgi:hypothetical protein
VRWQIGSKGRAKPRDSGRRLKELVLAGEDRRDRLVREHVLDRVREEDRDGERFREVGRPKKRVHRDRIRDDDLPELALRELLEGALGDERMRGARVDLVPGASCS